MCKQGPVHFDENGICSVTELRVLQYRTNYVNGTPIDSVGEGSLPTPVTSTRLKLIDVAHIRNSDENLEFLAGDRNSI